MAEGEAIRAEKDPKLNPSGRGKFKGSASYDEPLGVASMSGREVQALPDPAASARGANVRANKARGTDSSSKRVPVK